MRKDFLLPAIAEGIQDGDVANILVREGDSIAEGDFVIELETDKAVADVPCPYAGTVAKIYVGKGQTIQPGQPVLSIDTAGHDETEPRTAEAASAPTRSNDGEQ
jgi:pyruvate/2-oxoglutarate dehydrogenase complex dihydrolipoamide acyltransferase (E2) component